LGEYLASDCVEIGEMRNYWDIVRGGGEEQLAYITKRTFHRKITLLLDNREQEETKILPSWDNITRHIDMQMV
jgi:hypothetical protein